jgi:2-oxo-4-hydroxy-4-carboxy--5-ureidoimidazoline (OHCU) decarboxylase
MIKDFLMKKMLERQLKNVPKEQQEQLIAMITKNPDFFQKIAIEVKTKTDSGMDQMKATMEVMKKYESELRQLQQSK